MPQSLVKNYVHLVWSTKHRQPFIKEEVQVELYDYLGGTLKEFECYPKAIGGVEDHVHIAMSLSQKVALMEVVGKVKSSSSKWMKTLGIDYANFYWQNGYGAFSINPSQIDIVIRYIKNQKEHHRRKTFKKEFRQFLKKYQIPYDERYVWD